MNVRFYRLPEAHEEEVNRQVERFIFFLYFGATDSSGPGPPHSGGLLWMSDQPDADIST
jgi:hypothetical protein